METITKHFHIFLAFFFICLFAPITCPAEDIFKAKIIVEVDLSGHDPQEKARLWLPYPMSDRFQAISDIDIQGTFSRSAVYTESEFGFPILYAEWKPGERDRRLRFSFVVERRERKDGPLRDPEIEFIDKSYFTDYLTSSTLRSLNDDVIALAKKITNGRHTPLQKARAVYEWVTSHMERDPKTRGCGKGDVCYLLFKKPSGKCADISSVFVVLMRAVGVPAREVFGLRLSDQAGSKDITRWQHCWSEFYLPGHGWVVADPADYLKFFKKRDLKPCSKEARLLHEYYFGAVDPKRVKFATGRDIILNPRQKNGPLNYFMYPYAEVGGNPIDFLSPGSFAYSITCIGYSSLIKRQNEHK